MPGTPLPTVESRAVQLITNEDPNFLDAYTICLQCKEQVAAFNPSKLRYVRILGYLLLCAPNQDIRSEVANCIHSSSRQVSSDLTDIGAFFERTVIVPLKKYKGDRTPKTSEYPSNRTFEAVNDKIKETPKNHQDAKHRALIRDNWRCVVLTGIFDNTAPKDIKGNSKAVFTQCAHIIPESTYFGVEPKSEEKPKLDYSASILAILKRFRCDISQFNGPKGHSLINVMSMEYNVRDAFDRLNLYLEATASFSTAAYLLSHNTHRVTVPPQSEENRYEVKWFGSELPHLHQFATFSTSDPENLPVPAPELLALHATCCKVAHLSGAAEYIDEIYRDAEEIGVLSTDGASGDTLAYLLSCISEPVSPRESSVIASKS